MPAQQQQIEPIHTLSQPPEYRLYGVLSDHIDIVWPDVAPILQKALDRADNRYLITDIYQAVVDKDMQLWVTFNHAGIVAAGITQIIQYPQKKILALPFVGGEEMPKWIDSVMHDIELFAREKGCDGIDLLGRPGWKKFINFNQYYIAMTKPL